MKRASSVLVLLLLVPLCLGADKNEPPKPPESIAELQQRLEKILKDSHVPGVSVAIVHRDGLEWVTALGKADVATGRAATSETSFRIGSTSKAFASLSILLLADQGKLSLNDPVHKLAPEIWFENKWEATDPVRVVNLLEHTTGWDDMHLREYAKDAPDIDLRTALDFDHHSRISRWRPGTRGAYCNSGPAVAAYIVEKITHQRFEDYVQQNLFQPIGMKTVTYFRPAVEATTVLYHDDGKTPYPYWNVIFRPAGSINASADDMAKYVQFYLNRGAVNGVQVVPRADIERMEVPESTWAAKEGMKTGYGLSDYWSIRDGFVYHGHNGGVNGGLTEMAYMPEYGVGYFYSINAGNVDAFQKIGKEICAYITRDLQKPALPPPVPLPPNTSDYAGWYEPDSPRVEVTHFLERLLGLSLVRIRDGKLLIADLSDLHEVYVPLSNSQFRHVPEKDAPHPVATLELLTPNTEGRFIQDGILTTMKRIPASMAYLEIVLTLFVVLSVIAIIVYAPFWLLGGLIKSHRRPAERAMRIWPLVAVLSLAAFVTIFAVTSPDIITRLGNFTVWSAGIWLSSVAFAVASLASAVALWRAPVEGVRRGVSKFCLTVTLALLIATAYLAYWGIIGLRTWA